MGGNKKKEANGNSSDSSLSSETTMSSVASDSTSQDDTRRRRRRKRRRETRSSGGSETDYSSSDDEPRKRRRKRRHRHDRVHKEKGEKKRKKEKHESKSKRLRKARKRDGEEEHASKKGASQAKLQVTMEAREQEKYLIYQNAELAKARLNGELREVQARQAKMQDMYGTIDWRARKKLRLEKKKLERSVAAGNKLAQLEEEETARMDAFRVALGLPTAEAQRQAEWRAEATRALSQEAHPSVLSSKPPKKAIIGPQRPR